MTPNSPSDPLQMLKSLWTQIPSPIPGFSVPTVDNDELTKRIRELKTVEGWLQNNLSMLQASIRALEVQQATLHALQSMAKQTEVDDSGAIKKGTEAQAWPWEALQQSGQAWIDAARAAAQSASDSSPPQKTKSKPARRSKPA